MKTKGQRGIYCAERIKGVRKLILNHCNSECEYWSKCPKHTNIKHLTIEFIKAIWQK